VSVDVDILSWLDQTAPVAVPGVRHTSTDTLTHTANSTCFEIQREVLLHMMEKAITAVPSKDIIPVYLNFQFRVRQDGLDIVASNEDMTVIVSTDQVQTKVAGTELFPAKNLVDIVREAGTGTTIYIEVTQAGAVIVAGNFSSEIELYAATKFPSPEDLSGVVFYDFDRMKFLNAISLVKYALPRKDFGGLATLKFVNIRNGKFTACDGSRFQQARVDEFDLNMKLAAGSIPALLKLMSTTDQETAQVAELDNWLVFRINSLVIYVKKKSSVYPNVEQLWLRPALANDQVLLVDKAELITAIKQVKTSADADSNAVGLIIESNHIEVRIKGSNGSARTTIPCTLEGKSRKFVVNYLHLAEMLKAYPEKECKFLLGEDSQTRKSAILLRNDDTMAIAVIPQMQAARAELLA
jgi:DNA polymerase-3 subunit beta